MKEKLKNMVVVYGSRKGIGVILFDFVVGSVCNFCYFLVG